MSDVVCEQIRIRIKVSVAAYAYEFEDDPIISDEEFDKLSLTINPEILTGNDMMDKFFREEFDPNTGSWVHRHPNKEGLSKIVSIHREVRK
jgi:hypothetical protein